MRRVICKASGTPQPVVSNLSPGSTGGHSTRDLAFSRDGKRLFISVGSQSNVAEGMPRKNAADQKAWDAKHGVGSSWDTEANRAAVLVFDLESNGPLKMFATGIRNCVGLTVQPATGEVWCTTNERDNLGDDLVPDYSTRVKQGGFYGWPWYYLGNNEDPRHKGERPDLAGKAIVPDVLLRGAFRGAEPHLLYGDLWKVGVPVSICGRRVRGAAWLVEPRAPHRAQGGAGAHERQRAHRPI